MSGGEVEDGVGEEGRATRLSEALREVFVYSADVEVDGGEIQRAAELPNQLVCGPRVLGIAVECVEDGTAGCAVAVESSLVLGGEVEPEIVRPVVRCAEGVAKRWCSGWIGGVESAGDVEGQAAHASASLEDLERRGIGVFAVLSRARQVQVQQ